MRNDKIQPWAKIISLNIPPETHPTKRCMVKRRSHDRNAGLEAAQIYVNHISGCLGVDLSVQFYGQMNNFASHVMSVKKFLWKTDNTTVTFE